MIGVIADPAEHGTIREFFEMFKTPWEFHQSGRQYEVLLCAGDVNFDGHTARLVLIYASRSVACDDRRKVEVGLRRSNRMLLYKRDRIPIYGDSVVFREKETDLLVDEETLQAVIHQQQCPRGVMARVGYDLFGEVNNLLTAGQPAAYAGIPTLDLHIAFLRDLIVANGIQLIEIPPVPYGYRSIACLTHDVDHPSIYRHKWDHTMFGFLHRAVLGSLASLFRGRLSVRDLIKNWTAALKLPFVYLGFAKDFWSGFADRYLELEKGLCSTFFVIPFKDDPGKVSGGVAPPFRAASYGAQDVADTIRKIMAAGCEVGLHGIDAWFDSTKGHEEFEEIRRLTGVSEIGVRMHWLYYDQQSAAVLERAEATYDSTIGYKETVGYRAGTTQAYKPLHVDRLLELPIHVMDTALFYPAYLGLSPQAAATVLRRLVDNVIYYGGCITINWHDRSLSPERLWCACYRDLIQDLKNRGAWFATAGQAIVWFQKRRSVAFETDGVETDSVLAKMSAVQDDSLPGLRLRIHNARASCEIGAHKSDEYIDMALNKNIGDRVLCGISR